MDTAREIIAVINAGSSTIKYAFFDAACEPPKLLLKKNVSASEDPLGAIAEQAKSSRLVAIGHRLVHGGPKYFRSMPLSSEVLAELRALAPLDPMHLPAQIKLIEKCTQTFPGIPQTLSFDTAFHHNLPELAQIIPIPARYRGDLVRRYGFHGISYQYLLKTFTQTVGEEAARGKIIFAHLGSGASMAAVSNGTCVETTMGFTPAGGFPMQTRMGDIDPGVLIYLLREFGLSVDELDRLVNAESGLRALANPKDGMKELLEKRKGGDLPSRTAVEYFCYGARRTIASLAGAMNGVDAIVFSGGIGENSAVLRGEICAGLSYMGIALDSSCNESGAGLISASSSKIQVWVIPTNEEIEIAAEAMKLIRN